MIALRAQEKAAALAAARSEHEEHEAKLASLRSVLADRAREPYPWDNVVAARGGFVPTPFDPPSFVPREAIVRRRIARRHPVWPWGVGTAALLAIAGVLSLSAMATLATSIGTSRWVGGGLLILLTVSCVLVAGAAGLGGFRAVSRRRPERARVIEELRLEHETARALDGRAHDAAQAKAGAEWEADEAFRARLRSATDDGDPEPLADLLEAELANETFPIPIVCDAEFDGCTRVLIVFELPEFDDVPEDRTLLTSTGKLSRKKMAQRDRLAIYEDLCCGVALRLAYEAFRVLPMLAEVSIEGAFVRVDATGAEEEGIALRLRVTRASFEQLLLDRLDPSECVRAVGAFGCSRRGELSALG